MPEEQSPKLGLFLEAVAIFRPVPPADTLRGGTVGPEGERLNRRMFSSSRPGERSPRWRGGTKTTGYRSRPRRAGRGQAGRAKVPLTPRPTPLPVFAEVIASRPLPPRDHGRLGLFGRKGRGAFNTPSHRRSLPSPRSSPRPRPTQRRRAFAGPGRKGRSAFNTPSHSSLPLGGPPSPRGVSPCSRRPARLLSLTPSPSPPRPLSPS